MFDAKQAIVELSALQRPAHCQTTCPSNLAPPTHFSKW